MEPKQNKPKSATKGTWGGRRPGVGAPKGNLNALKHGRFSRYQQTLIEIMIAITKRQRTQTVRQPSAKRPTGFASPKRENSPLSEISRDATKSARPKPRFNQTLPLAPGSFPPFQPHAIIPSARDGRPLTVYLSGV